MLKDFAVCLLLLLQCVVSPSSLRVLGSMESESRAPEVDSGASATQPGGQPSVQSSGDLGFDSHVARPAHSKSHPKVLFDEAHGNADTSGGRYRPFADLITSDGYAVRPNSEKLSRSVLKDYQILIVVNASGPPGQRSASPFSDSECEAVRDWVKAGGSLLLISDQAPFSTAMAGLAERFDVNITKGFTVDPIHHDKGSGDETELVFSRDNSLLGDHPITRGRDATERINRIVSFTGTSLKGPVGSIPFLKLGDTAKDVIPSDVIPSAPGEAAPDPKQTSAAGRAQAIALGFGNGRVVVLGEAAMLTAQVALKGFRFGMNVPGIDNRQLALNIMHWLSGSIK